MALVVFDPETFKAAYPQWSSFSNAQLAEAFAVACLLCPNTEASRIPYCPNSAIHTRATLLYLLVSHLCALSQRGGVVGSLSSASEGSVSSSFTVPQISNAEWFAQTPCGLTYWQATAKYRVGGAIMAAVSVSISGKNAWEKALDSYIGGAAASAVVGILPGTTYSGETENAGLLVASVAATHEFGTENVPARSFMRSTLAQKRNEWVQKALAHLKAKPGDLQGALTAIGFAAVADMTNTIEEGISPPLAPQTIIKKTRNKASKGKPALPLVDTGTMADSLAFEVSGMAPVYPNKKEGE